MKIEIKWVGREHIINLSNLVLLIDRAKHNNCMNHRIEETLNKLEQLINLDRLLEQVAEQMASKAQ